MTNDLIELIIADAEDKMDKAVAHARHEFSTIRTGRPNPSLIERLPVDYYGTEVPLLQLASFSVPEAQQLVVAPFDKGAMTSIEKAIQQSDLGLTPSSDGVVLRLTFPPLTEERRRDLIKVCRSMAEEGRVTVRNVRRSARQELEALDKEGDASSDEVRRAEESVDSLTRSHEDSINAALAQKEEELLEV
jgi:ribosome recycling factor